MHFAASGFFEGLGALLSPMALGAGTIVVVSPIVCDHAAVESAGGTIAITLGK
jgi:hypothetical protein